MFWELNVEFKNLREHIWYWGFCCFLVQPDNFILLIPPYHY